VRNILPENLGLSGTPGMVPKQALYAALLSCADARVPPELVFTQAANHLFVVRVAGNVLTASGLGSLDYAVENLDSVRLLVVLGHTGCGAVTAAVEAYLKPDSYINVPNYRLALIEMAVSMNAAMVAEIVQNSFSSLIDEKLDVAYGVYNLQDRLVGRPGGDSTPENWEGGLFSPPQDEDGFVKLSEELARSAFIEKLLNSQE
jgi:carbonic anhydrase